MTDPMLPRKTGRGGRMPGSKNKRTLYREKRLIASQASKAIDLLENKSLAEVTKINGADFIAESVNAMGEALGFFLQMARSEADPKQRRVYYHDVLTAGEKIAPFYRPKLASIHNSVSKQSALERPGTVEGEVYAEVMAEIVAEIVQIGELPRPVKAYLSNVGSNSANVGGKIGGVANRNAD
jgi:hypothetical protein